jgi:hypothetical protein
MLFRTITALPSGLHKQVEFVAKNPSVDLRGDKCLVTHENSVQHISAVDAYKQTVLASLRGGADNPIGVGFTTMENMNKLSLVARIRILLHICQKRKPLSDYKDLYGLVKDLRCPDIPMQYRDNDRKGIDYKSEDFVREVLAALSDEILQQLVVKIQKSPVVSIMMDEARDVSNQEDLIVYVKYFDTLQGTAHTAMLFLSRIPDGSGETIVDAVTQKLAQLGITVHNIIGLSCDGAG